MSFGFSVGDFIAAADLIAQVVSALREAGGSASQYQHITNKLGFLDRAIRDVNRLEPPEGLEATLEVIKTTALSCQLPLLEYLENIRRYDKSLGPRPSSGVMKDVFFKMNWQVSKKLEAAMKLEAEIATYFGAINLLLGLYKVKVDALAEQRARSTFESLTATVANLLIQTQTVSKNVTQVRYQVEQGTRVVRKDIEESSKETSQALKSLQQNYSASVSECLKTAGTLAEVTLRTWSKVSEIYDAILWVRTSLSRPDTRHTWFQEPMRWEDAYGRVFPIPAEFDYPMMEGAIRGHFREGRGKKLVERNQWQLFDPSNPRTVFSAKNWESFPGMKITMAMIIPQFNNQMVCPRLNCSSKSYTDAFGGGKICSECMAWFDSLPKSSSPQKITEIFNSKQYSRSSGETEGAKLPAETTGAAKSGLQARDEDTGSDSEFEIDEEDLRHLKNARVQLQGPKLTSAPHSAQDMSDHLTRPLWLPLSIEVEDIDQVDNDDLSRRSSALRNITIDEEDAEELRINKTGAFVPITLEWHQGGEKVYVTGTIFQWNKTHRLHPVDGRPGLLRSTIHARPGTHHIKFIVDGHLQISTNLPTTVDFGNNLVNYIEVSADDP